MRTLTTIALLSTVSASLAQVETFTFAEIDGHPIELDFRRPASATPTPLIIWIHGGGWSGPGRSFPLYLRSFLDDGYAVASINYRLTSEAGQWGDAPVVWPAQAHDCKAAVRWLRANADDLNIDPCKFIAWGSSAGGHLTAVLATSNGNPYLEGRLGEFGDVSSDIQLAIDYYGPTDLLYMQPDVTDPPGSIKDHDAIDSGESLLLGAEVHGYSVGEIRAHIDDPTEPWVSLNRLASSASPAQLALHERSNVPTFIAHGQMDPVVPYLQSIRLRDAFNSVGTPTELVPVPDAGHGLPPSMAADVRAWLDARVPLLGECRCLADIDGDGELSVFDFLAFQNLFAMGDPTADLDGDGVLTLFDFLAFQSAFDTGC